MEKINKLKKIFKSENIESILGYRGKDEVVHRDDFVVEKNKSETK